jgi:hypothetical protein
MTNIPSVTLRYFDCRGRAQHLRYFLRGRNIPFTDERVPLSGDFSEWRAIQPDRTRSGYFQKLPILHWGEELVAETSVIHHFLHRQLQDDQRLSAAENLHHEMLASSCFGDIMLPAGLLIWSELAVPGADLAKLAPISLERVRSHLAVLERTLTEWDWWDQRQRRELMVTDCLLWEGLSVALHTFGPGLQLESCPHLFEFHQNSAVQAIFTAMLAERACQITGRPGEAETIQRIQAVL